MSQHISGQRNKIIRFQWKELSFRVQPFPSWLKKKNYYFGFTYFKLASESYDNKDVHFKITAFLSFILFKRKFANISSMYQFMTKLSKQKTLQPLFCHLNYAMPLNLKFDARKTLRIMLKTPYQKWVVPKTVLSLFSYLSSFCQTQTSLFPVTPHTQEFSWVS